jgi:hypothetical protein
MTTIATLAIKLIGDIKDYTSAMTEAESKAKATASKIGEDLKNIGGKITSLGKTATVGLTLPIVGLGALAVSAASDLSETQNKVQVVFGNMSDSVLEWSKTSATALGQSQQQALEAAGTYGNLFTALGLGQKPAADMSMSLVQLASDLASFNNADPSDVLQALRSGMSGEVEPLKKFGIAMNEVILKQKAMEMGFGDNIQALTEAQKLQVRYAIIMGQTATAQGDFARTSDGLANSTRIMKAEMTDAAAALGQQLLPYALQAVHFISGLITKFTQLSPGMQKIIVIVLALVAAIGPLLIIIGSVTSAIGSIITVAGTLGPLLGTIGTVITGTVLPALGSMLAALAPIILPILAIIAVVALLYLAWKNNWGGIQEKTAAVWAWLKNAFADGVAFIKSIWQSLQPAIQFVLTFIKTIIAAWQAAFHGDWRRFGELLRVAWDMVWGAIGTIIRNAGQMILNTLRTLATNAINSFRNIDWGSVGKNVVQGIANGITSGVKWIVDAAKRAARAALEAVQGFLGIHSESKVFKYQVGWEMGAGTASGFGESIDKLLKPSFGQLVPGTATVPGLSTGGVGNSGLNNGQVITLLQQIAGKPTLNEKELGRVIRDLVVQVMK